jgi:hypothetical protein
MSERATLKSFRVPRRDVPTSGGVFSVRGVSLVDLTGVFLEHRHEMSALYDRVMKGDISVDPETAILQALASAPNVLASLIAHAVDEPDEAATVLTMPLADQIALSLVALQITFESGGGIKKVIETVIKSLQSLEIVPTSISSQS